MNDIARPDPIILHLVFRLIEVIEQLKKEIL